MAAGEKTWECNKQPNHFHRVHEDDPCVIIEQGTHKQFVAMAAVAGQGLISKEKLLQLGRQFDEATLPVLLDYMGEAKSFGMPAFKKI